MITDCKTVSILDSMFCSYRFPVLNHISFNTQSLYLLGSVYPSMFLINSSFSCCFAKMRRRLDGISLKMHTSSLSECCIWRSTVNVSEVLLHKIMVFFRSWKPCLVIVTWHLHNRMFFHFFHHWNDLFVKKGASSVFELLAQKREILSFKSHSLQKPL